MPIHFKDTDPVSQAAGLRSLLIVPCQVCPAITIAVREKKPFLSVFTHFLNSKPFEDYIENLQLRCQNNGIHTEVFGNPLPHQWFLCMWTRGQSRKLRDRSKETDGVIVLGCDSATVTVSEAIHPNCTRIIPGMAATGIMNARLTFKFPGHISVDRKRIVPLPRTSQAPETCQGDRTADPLQI